MKKQVCCAALATIVLMCAACGGRVNLIAEQDPDKVSPPAQAGTEDQLIGSSWLFAKNDMVVSFAAAQAARVSNPANPSEGGPASWSLRPNGVLSLSLLGTRFAGTWDGTIVVLNGEQGSSTAK